MLTEKNISEIRVGLITDPLYLPLKRGGLVCLPCERTMIRRNKSVSIGGICGRIKLIISGSMYLKICEMLGGVGEKIYLCIINV